MFTILTLVLLTILVIAVDFAYTLFQKTGVYRSLRDLLARLSEKLKLLLFR